jgi:hypothetical protein
MRQFSMGTRARDLFAAMHFVVARCRASAAQLFAEPAVEAPQSK